MQNFIKLFRASLIARLLYTLPFFFLAACSTMSRGKNAQDIAIPAGLTQTTVAAAPFLLAQFARIGSPGQEAHLYIEGDGLAWLGQRTPSLDPTPTNPVALKLAAADPAANVIYLARPCQYTKLVTDGACQQKYWTSHRFAPEVIDSMNEALDAIKAQNRISGFHLIGFSGGANIAALLAAERNDILSLRTVAGNLDHVLLHKMHNVSQTLSSLNAKDQAKATSRIPQYHFIGGADEIVSPAIAQSFISAAGQTRCIQTQIVPGLGHDAGWAAIWPSLLARPVACLEENDLPYAFADHHIE